MYAVRTHVIRWMVNSSMRPMSSGKGFSSILGGSQVTSPFSDPSRTRKAVGPTSDLLSNKSTDVNTESPTPKVVPATEPVIPQSAQLSAIEELNLVSESLKKLEKTVKSDSSFGSGSSGDDSSHQYFDAEAEREKRRKRMERNTKVGGLFLLGSAAVGLVSFCLYYGRAKRDEAGNIIYDAHQGSILAPLYRIYDSILEWRSFIVEPSREKLLPDPLQYPYLQPKYTVVIELKNLLVSPEWTYKTGYRFVKRPALDYFLDVVGYPNFEVVIYSSEPGMMIAPVVESLDPKQRIMFKLYKDCTKYANGHHMKDLSKLNRDLSKVIYIDWDAKAGSLNPENMLRVPEWKGNMNDTSLVDLAELLKAIHLSDTDDVRPIVQSYSQYDDPTVEFRRRASYIAEQDEIRKHGNESEGQSVLKRYSGRLFGYRRHQAS